MCLSARFASVHDVPVEWMLRKEMQILVKAMPRNSEFRPPKGANAPNRELRNAIHHQRCIVQGSAKSAPASPHAAEEGKRGGASPMSELAKGVAKMGIEPRAGVGGGGAGSELGKLKEQVRRLQEREKEMQAEIDRLTQELGARSQPSPREEPDGLDVCIWCDQKWPVGSGSGVGARERQYTKEEPRVSRRSNKGVPGLVLGVHDEACAVQSTKGGIAFNVDR
jgi:hypothetical protein